MDTFCNSVEGNSNLFGFDYRVGTNFLQMPCVFFCDSNSIPCLPMPEARYPGHCSTLSCLLSKRVFVTDSPSIACKVSPTGDSFSYPFETCRTSMEGSQSPGWRTTMCKDKQRGIQLEKWKQDACEAVDNAILKWRAEEDLLLSDAAGPVRVPPCKASRVQYDQLGVHGSSISCMKERQHLVHELHLLKAKELVAQGDLHSAVSRIRILEENLSVCPKCKGYGDGPVNDLYTAQERIRVLEEKESNAVSDLRTQIRTLVEENQLLKSDLRNLRAEHTGTLEELRQASEIKKKLYQEWMEEHWPDVVISSLNVDTGASPVSGIDQSPVVDTASTSTSRSADSNLNPRRKHGKSYAYYKTAGRSSSFSALTHECTAGSDEFFAVCTGNRPGVYLDYADCCKAMEGHQNPIFMKFSTREDAEWFVKNGHDFVPRHGRRF